jgi:hypothetical protein
MITMGDHADVKQALIRQGWVCDQERKLWSHEAEDAQDLSFKQAAIYAIERAPRRS